MPVYVFSCDNGHRFDRFLPLDEYDTPQTCDCGAEAHRKIVPTMLNCDIAPWDAYISPATGKPITSYKERREDMARSGCVDYDEGMKRDQKAMIKQGDDALDKAIDQTVEKEISKMDAHKKERLYNEMQHNDLSYERH